MVAAAESLSPPGFLNGWSLFADIRCRRDLPRFAEGKGSNIGDVGDSQQRFAEGKGNTVGNVGDVGDA